MRRRHQGRREWSRTTRGTWPEALEAADPADWPVEGQFHSERPEFENLWRAFLDAAREFASG